MIRFENLCAGYDGVEKLHSISLSIPAGRLTALVGPNGCGKSTLVKTAAGIIKPVCGTISIGGRDISVLSPKALAKTIAYMPQSRPAPEMTVRQLTAHGRYPHLKWGRSLSEEDRAIIRDAMIRTDTLSLSEKRVDQLSGGERQRTYLAMMLAQQSPIMLLDEPTTYLDLRAQFDMLALLKELVSDGRTVLIVLHDLALALEYCDNVVLMDSGRIITSGNPESVFASGFLESIFSVSAEHLNNSYHFYVDPH